MSLKALTRRTLVPAFVAVAALTPSAAFAAETEAVPVGVEVFIDHVQTGEHLTPNGFATTPTGLVDLWEDHNGVIVDAEKWVYESVNGSADTFRIKNAGGNVCLEPDRVEYRKVVSTKTCSTSNKQQWWYLAITDTGVRNGFTIRPYNDTSLAITPSSVPTGNDHYTVLSPVGDYMNQVFRNRLA
ncbi:RICIN domain-containing protein [Stackebrandtia soli]|uniref:RICIN domain-containing protein n=1 Tax=Stackebrandtia soli TaxID=1892856 RepID=UPI0039EC1E48